MTSGTGPLTPASAPASPSGSDVAPTGVWPSDYAADGEAARTAARGPGATVGAGLAVGSAAKTPAQQQVALLHLSASAVMPTMLEAYRMAQQELAASQPGCHLTWPMLAAIGRVESDNGADVPAGGGISPNGTISPPILGPALDGHSGFAAIADGAAWARATGPFQFIPSTWASWGTDGNGDGAADPNNVYDASLTAGRYLCASGRDLQVPTALAAAAYSYNHSRDYATLVVRLYAEYANLDPDQLTAAADLTALPANPAPGVSVVAANVAAAAAPLRPPASSVRPTAGPSSAPSGPAHPPVAPTRAVSPPSPSSSPVQSSPVPAPTMQFSETLTRRSAKTSIVGSDVVGATTAAVAVEERWTFTLSAGLATAPAPTLDLTSGTPGWTVVSTTPTQGQTVVTVAFDQACDPAGCQIEAPRLILQVHGGVLTAAVHTLTVSVPGAARPLASVSNSAVISDGTQTLTGQSQ